MRLSIHVPCLQNLRDRLSNLYYNIFVYSRAATILGITRVVGQAGSLRSIVNRPNVANVQHSSFAACRYAGQVVQPAADCQTACRDGDTAYLVISAAAGSWFTFQP